MHSVAWGVKAAPASPLEVSEAEFALEFLVVAFDAPAQFRGVDENLDRGVLGRVESQCFVGSFSPSGHSTSNPSSGCGAASFQSREAGRIRTAAKREDKVWLEPSRHDTSRQASGRSAIANVLAETGR